MEEKIRNGRVGFVDIRLDDILEMKKTHPCGGKTWKVLRVGMDFRLRCETCGHEVMIPRVKMEKNVRRIHRAGDSPEQAEN